MILSEANLHNYQKYSVDFIINHPAAALLLDCGCGKTVITLTAVNDLMFDRFEVHKVLIIAPLRVARFSWGAEIRKWEHLRNLRYSIVVGTQKMGASEKSPLQHRCRHRKRTQSNITAKSGYLHHQP